MSATWPWSTNELVTERERLLAFGRAARVPRGFGHLDECGRIAPNRPIPTYQTCRLTFSFVLSCHLGNHQDRELVDHGLDALGGARDRTAGGWYASIDPDGAPVDPRKDAYTHAFVLIALAAATSLGDTRSHSLFAEALEVIESYFWCEQQAVLRESFDAWWRDEDPYRGANSNMHAVEAFLAVADATGDARWLRRADMIAIRFINDVARRHAWRLPEHYDATLTPQLDYNQHAPADHFRPFGVTPGHLFEWARLCIALAASLERHQVPTEAAWHRPAAQALYRRAVEDGWAADGRSGFLYTTDFSGAPVVRTRMHWVIAEALSAAATLHTATGDEQYRDDFQLWWDEVQRYFVDTENGSWHHALDETNRPSPSTWQGKPDLYHALQAVVIPGTDPAPSLPFQLGRRRSDRRWLP